MKQQPIDKTDDLEQFVAELEMEIRTLENELDGAYQFIDYLIDILENNNIKIYD